MVSSGSFAIDLGTNNIKIYSSAGERIMVQKNMIAIENKKRMIAYGDAAYEMFEKAPGNISVTAPMSSGVIADIRNMEQLLKAFMQEVQGGPLRPGDYFIAIPTDVTEVEKRAFYDLVRDAGIRARKIMAVEKAIADGLGMGIDVDSFARRHRPVEDHQGRRPRVRRLDRERRAPRIQPRDRHEDGGERPHRLQ